MEITETQKAEFKQGFVVGAMSFLIVKILHKFFNKIPA
jgi:hypothetical protein